LHQILADPGAAEEDWLAACYEMEKHPNYKTFNSKPSSNWSDRKKLLQACTAIALIGMSAVMLVHNFTNHRPAPVLGHLPLPPAQIAPTADVDFGPFMANLQRQIKRNWYPPKSDITSKGMVAFKVARNGDISFIRIIKPGPSDAFDRAEVTAISNASPSFGPLPEGSPKDVDIQFTFDYNVFDRGNSN
jgi:TonB family protein